MSRPTPDIIDLLVGIEPGSHLDRIRARRPEARENAQKSYLALFEPEIRGNVTAEERYAVAAFVSGLHREPAVAEFYASGLRQHGPAGLSAAVEAQIAQGATQGPYGKYPHGPLTKEDRSGLIFRVSEDAAATLGPRLAAALEHAHLLVFRPRNASPEALQALLDAGWTTTDIVTLSQLVAFLSFQVRVIAGLRSLAAVSGREGASALSLAGAAASGRI